MSRYGARYRASCVLCGVPIDGQVATWLNEFRAIYTEDDEWMRPRLSGVGIRTPLADLAPTDATARYDDPNLDPSSLKDIWLLRSSFGTQSQAVPQAVPPVAPDPAWGFPSHASCWGLFSAQHHLKEVDIQFLNKLWRSCPQQCGLLNWGHDYGGLVQYASEDVLPGEERETATIFNFDHAAGETFSSSMYSSDPLDIPGLERVLHQSSKPEINEDKKVQKTLGVASGTQDCFKQLPVELLQEILSLLPSRDVLNLKLASAVFAIMPLPETFWASRFLPEFEFECIFEARKCPTKPRRWKQLYFGIRDLRNNFSFRNRRRVWEILLRLERLLFSLSSTILEGSPSRSFFEPDAPEDDLSWTFANGRLKCPDGSFEKGCRALWTRTINFPESIIGILVSFVDFSNAKYVSGVRFRQQGGTDVCLGYRHPKNELSMKMDFRLDHPDGYSISGFYLAIDPRGIRAISLVTNVGQRSEWLGNREGVPERRLVARHQTLVALKGGFDALKLVSLGISGDSSGNDNEHAPLASSMSLRDTAQWFPEIPHERLLLNEAPFLDMPKHVLDHRPFTVLHYGGSQGTNLSKLTGIAVWIVDFERIYGIEFLYNTEIDGQKVHTLGHRWPFSNAEPRSYESCDSSTDQRITFDIDGPGGEIIDGMDIQEDKNMFSNQLQGFRIHTNRGRTATFPPEPDLRDDLPLLPFPVARSTVITGFYARLEYHVILLNLGLISEKV